MTAPTKILVQALPRYATYPPCTFNTPVTTHVWAKSEELHPTRREGEEESCEGRSASGRHERRRVEHEGLRGATKLQRLACVSH